MQLSVFSDLIAEGHLTEDALLDCQQEEQATGKPLDRILRHRGLVTESILLEFLARRLRIPFVPSLKDLCESYPHYG